MAEWEFSKDNKYFSYGISKGGSDWREFYVIDVQSKQLTKDTIKWAKFTSASWYKNGFYYGAYDKPASGQELKVLNEYQKIYYHISGTPQSQDKLILEDKTNPKLNFGAAVTDDERYLIITVENGASTYDRLWCKDLSGNDGLIKFLDKNDANYSVVDNIGDKFLIVTNLDAPKNKLVLIDPNNPSKENWKTIIPESKECNAIGFFYRRETNCNLYERCR